MQFRFWGFEAVYAGSYFINLREANAFTARFTGSAAVAALLIPLAIELLSLVNKGHEKTLIIAVAGSLSLVLVDARRGSVVEYFRALDGELSIGYRLSLVAFVLLGVMCTAFASRGGPGLVLAVTAAVALFPLFPLQRALGWGIDGGRSWRQALSEEGALRATDLSVIQSDAQLRLLSDLIREGNASLETYQTAISLLGGSLSVRGMPPRRRLGVKLAGSTMCFSNIGALRRWYLLSAIPYAASRPNNSSKPTPLRGAA